MVIYIAGPITNTLNYRSSFSAAERMLRADGHIVFNPSSLPVGLPHDSYLPIGRAMMDAGDAVYFLRGWESSAGARSEFDYATKHSKRLMFEDGGADNE